MRRVSRRQSAQGKSARTHGLRLEPLNVTHLLRATSECVRDLARVSGTEVGEIETRGTDGGVRGGCRWRTRRAGQSTGLQQRCCHGRRTRRPRRLEDVPHRFAVWRVCEPSRQYVVARIVPDEQTPTGIVWIPPMARVIEADVGCGFCGACIGDGEGRIWDHECFWGTTKCRVNHAEGVVACWQSAQIDFLAKRGRTKRDGIVSSLA